MSDLRVLRLAHRPAHSGVGQVSMSSNSKLRTCVPMKGVTVRDIRDPRALKLKHFLAHAS